MLQSCAVDMQSLANRLAVEEGVRVDVFDNRLWLSLSKRAINKLVEWLRLFGNGVFVVRIRVEFLFFLRLKVKLS